MKQSQRIRGVLSPVVTPFNKDLSPDPARFIAHCRWLLTQNCGLAVFGTNSEANSLSVNERIALLDSLLTADVDPSRMMPGTGCCALRCKLSMAPPPAIRRLLNVTPLCYSHPRCSPAARFRAAAVPEL